MKLVICYFKISEQRQFVHALPNIRTQQIVSDTCPSLSTFVFKKCRICNRNNLLSDEMKSCLVSVFEVGISCSLGLPKERMSIGAVQAQLLSIRNKLLKSRQDTERGMVGGIRHCWRIKIF